MVFSFEKQKKEITIVNAFQNILGSSNRKPRKIWVDQGDEFYNYLSKRFLKNNSIEMYSTYNEEKFAVGERFIRTLKNKIFKHMTTIPNNVSFDVLDDIVDKYNNTVHRTIKMKAIDITSDSYAKYNEDLIKKTLNLKSMILSEYQKTKTFLLKDILKIGLKKILLLAKLKNTVPWTYVISDLF